MFNLSFERLNRQHWAADYTGDAATHHEAGEVDVGHAYGNIQPITVVSNHDGFDTNTLGSRDEMQTRHFP